MPPELYTLQLKEGLVSSWIWLGPTFWHRDGEPDDIVFSRLSPLLQRHSSIGSVLVWDRLELPIRPLEHDRALGASLVTRLQEHLGGIRDLSAIIAHHVETDSTAAVLRRAVVLPVFCLLYVRVGSKVLGKPFVGQIDDLPSITPYERELPEVPDHIRQQAVLTEKAIRDRANPASK